MRRDESRSKQTIKKCKFHALASIFDDKSSSLFWLFLQKVHKVCQMSFPIYMILRSRSYLRLAIAGLLLFTYFLRNLELYAWGVLSLLHASFLYDNSNNGPTLLTDAAFGVTGKSLTR